MKLLENPPNPLLHVFVCINDRTSKNQNMDSCAPEITAVEFHNSAKNFQKVPL